MKAVLMRFPNLALLSALALSACSGDAVREVRVDLVFDPDVVDFRQVFVDEQSAREVLVRNRSRRSVEVDFDADLDFDVSPGRVRLGPGMSSVLEVTFMPLTTGPQEASLRARVDSEEFAAGLRGAGTLRSVALPERLDFDDTRVGSRRTAPLVLTNHASLGQEVLVAMEGDDASAFHAPASIDLAPGETRLIEVAFTPAVERVHRARLRVRLCDQCDDPAVSLGGRGIAEGVAVHPSALDFGAVRLGTTASAEVIVTNQSSASTTVLSTALVASGGSPFTASLPSPGLEMEPRGSVSIRVEFAPQQIGEYDALLRFQIGTRLVEVPLSGRSHDVDLVAEPATVHFGSTSTAAWVDLRVRVHATGPGVSLSALAIEGDDAFTLRSPPTFPVDLDLGPLDQWVRFRSGVLGRKTAELVVSSDAVGGGLRVPLVGSIVSAGPCQLEAARDTVRFGIVAPGDSARRTVDLQNVGESPCDVWQLAIQDAGPFSIVSPPSGVESVPPGVSLPVEVEYAPARSALAADEAVLRVDHSPPGSEPVLVALSGLAVDSPPIAAPKPLDFGVRPIGSRNLRSVTVSNPRATPLELVGASVEGDLSFALASPTIFPRRISPSAADIASIEFSPVAEGPAQGELLLWFRDLAEPLTVEVQGVGSDEVCEGSCLSPQVTCPANRTIFVHTTTRLHGITVAPDPIASCIWRVDSAPMAAAAVPAATGTCAADFQPDRVGDWVLRLTARDNVGREATCDTEIRVEPLPALLVETTWSGPDDLDLHLIHPNAGPATDAASWFSVPWDCFFGNTGPSWDAQARADDPFLSIDDVAGTGPEQVFIAEPTTAQPYSIGIHWFDAMHGNIGITATTRVYCDGILAAEVDSELEAMNRAVVVGEVVFDESRQCTFTLDGTRLWVMP